MADEAQHGPGEACIRWPYMLLDRSSDLMPRQGEWASPPEVSIPVPAAGSSALGTAVLGLRPVDDLLARPRPPAPSRGAYDPNA